MVDIATSLTAAMERATARIIDMVAKDGLLVLRRVLDNSGFRASPYLKDYQIYAHVSGETITFEIILSAESVKPENEAARTDMETESRARQRVADIVEKTYGMSEKGPRLIQGQRDARKPLTDARNRHGTALKTSQDRLIGHELALHSPRSMNVAGDGRLSISFRRSIRETRSGFHFPRSEFSGIPGQFLEGLQSVILKQFGPELTSLIEDYA